MRTIFNVLGPLTNPAGANVQVLGVFSRELTEPLCNVLRKLGSKRAMVVHGEGNLDELTVTGQTQISELVDGKVENYTITPEDVGLARCTIEDLKGGDTSQESAEQLKKILGGEKGAKRDMVLINSGAALFVAGNCNSLREGVSRAGKILDSGAALEKMETLVNLSQKLQ